MNVVCALKLLTDETIRYTIYLSLNKYIHVGLLSIFELLWYCLWVWKTPKFNKQTRGTLRPGFIQNRNEFTLSNLFMMKDCWQKESLFSIFYGWIASLHLHWCNFRRHHHFLFFILSHEFIGEIDIELLRRSRQWRSGLCLETKHNFYMSTSPFML